MEPHADLSEERTKETPPGQSTEVVSPTATAVAPSAVEISDATRTTSSPYVGRWNELVSTTNWDKGAVIAEWRSTLEQAGAPLTERSDEAWAQLVGNVTSQHTGRLRRVHQRFADVRSEYSGLFWSHFQSAIDWDDAEMWLEGAITNEWSVSKMRAARWEAVGAPDGVKPQDEEILEGEIEGEVYDAFNEPDPGDPQDASPKSSSETDDLPGDPQPSDESEPTEVAPAAERIRPFEELAELPDDVAEVFEQFKLVILGHKIAGWESITRDDLVASLDALKALALAPADDA